MNINQAIETTDLTLAEIATHQGVSLKRVRSVWEKYPATFRRNRKAKTYRNSKLAELNPMLGQCGDQHPRYVGVVDDAKGYLMALKPSWYTGRKGSKHVFLHHIVVCENMGLTAIPQGWCVHHCDMNPHNNGFDNLVLMTLCDHNRFHAAARAGVTTMEKSSTLKWVEAHGTPFRRDEIVCSAWEHAAAHEGGYGVTTHAEH